MERAICGKEEPFAASLADHVESDCVDDFASRRFLQKIPDQLVFFCRGNGSGVVCGDGENIDLVVRARAEWFFRVVAKKIDAFFHWFAGRCAPAVFDFQVDLERSIQNAESPIHRRGPLFRAAQERALHFNGIWDDPMPAGKPPDFVEGIEVLGGRADSFAQRLVSEPELGDDGVSSFRNLGEAREAFAGKAGSVHEVGVLLESRRGLVEIMSAGSEDIFHDFEKQARSRVGDLAGGENLELSKAEFFQVLVEPFRTLEESVF